MRPITVRNMKYPNMIRMNQYIHEQLEKDGSVSVVTIDFDNLKWIDPAGAVVFLETIENLREKEIKVDFSPLNTEKSAISYGIAMGIFQKLGLSDSDSKEEGGTYLAPKKITMIEVSDFLEKESKQLEFYFEHISEKISKKVLRYYEREYDENIKELFTYLVRELIRNIFDHSESEYFYYGSQFIPSTSKVELVISDRGLGLRNTVPFDDEERWFKRDTTEKAIKKAFIPGITAASNHSYASHDYMNSGYGLAMVRSMILEAEGVLSLATSDKSITFTEGSQETENCNIKGTLLRIRVDLDKLSMVNFNKQLELLENEAKAFGTGSTPSRRSKTLKNLT